MSVSPESTKHSFPIGPAALGPQVLGPEVFGPEVLGSEVIGSEVLGLQPHQQGDGRAGLVQI